MYLEDCRCRQSCLVGPKGKWSWRRSRQPQKDYVEATKQSRGITLDRWNCDHTPECTTHYTHHTPECTTHYTHHTTHQNALHTTHTHTHQIALCKHQASTTHHTPHATHQNGLYCSLDQKNKALILCTKLQSTMFVHIAKCPIKL